MLLACLVIAAPAEARSVLGAQFRYWDFSDGNAMRNPIVGLGHGPLHLRLEVWDFERGEDRVRPEAGITLKDARRSAYTLMWRHEGRTERLGFLTEQTLGRRFVARGGVSPIIGGDEVLTVWEAGADVYFGSYGFAGVTLVRDPRARDLWVVPMRVRFASESNDWLQLTLAPASERSIGWAVDARSGWLRAGIERNSRYDFTDLDNTILTIGVEHTLAPRGASR